MVYTESDDDEHLDDRFDWDEGNAPHIAEHGVEWWEAEEALLDTDLFELSQGWRNDEYRYAIVGRTESGRTLTVVFVHRADKVRVVTARQASAHEAGLYERHSED